MSQAPVLSIEAFGRQLRSGTITAEALIEECLQRIERQNPQLNAFILVMADEARRQAREADRELAAGNDRGPLHGVPVSIKDIIDVRGTPTTAASRVREGHVAANDAPAIAALRHAGAIIIGKTNLHEFAFGTTNEDSAYGAARNPIDPARSPGGSSGGSGASLAAGMALGSLGSDTGGSIRIPSAVCGVVGLKPTIGELPMGGVIPLSRTLDHLGPMASTVTGTWIMFRALIGDVNPHPLKAKPVGQLRLGVPRDFFCDVLEDDVRARFEAALQAIRKAGATIDEVTIPQAADAAAIYVHIVLSEAAAYHAVTLEALPHRYSAAVRQRLEMGRYVLAEDYVRAQAGRQALHAQVDAALAGLDALVLPTMPIEAPRLGTQTVRIGTSEQPIRNLMLRLTQPFNLSGHPALSLPCGRTTAGLPCGLQLVGHRMETQDLLEVAAAIEPTV